MAEKNINVLKWDDIPRVKRGRGIVNHPIATKELGAQAIHSGITIMPAHTRVPDHTHNEEDRFASVREGAVDVRRAISDERVDFLVEVVDELVLHVRADEG